MSIFLTFDDEVVERSEANKGDILVSSKLKDLVRQQAIKPIVEILIQTLQNQQQLKDELVNDTLLCLAQLIDWNDLELFKPYF